MKRCEHCGQVTDARFWNYEVRRALDDFAMAMMALDWDGVSPTLLTIYLMRGLRSEPLTAAEEAAVAGALAR